jgi:hypothetical protein
LRSPSAKVDREPVITASSPGGPLRRRLVEHGSVTPTFGAFLTSGDSVEAVFENWEGEFLQMGAYVVLVLYENSLLLLFGVLFLVAFVLHLAGGAVTVRGEQVEHGAVPVTVWECFGTSRFWFESLQNRQSEFLVVAVLVGAAVYLRQRGSGQSKPVAAPHSEIVSPFRRERVAPVGRGVRAWPGIW